MPAKKMSVAGMNLRNRRKTEIHKTVSSTQFRRINPKHAQSEYGMKTRVIMK